MGFFLWNKIGDFVNSFGIVNYNMYICFMKKEIVINPNNLFTKFEYHKTFGINRVKIDKMIKDKELKTIKVKGTTLIIKQ